MAMVRRVLLKEVIWRYAVKLIDELGDKEAARLLECSEGKIRQFRTARDGYVPTDVVDVLTGRKASEILQELAPYAAAQEAGGGEMFRAPPAKLTQPEPVRGRRGRAAKKKATPSVAAREIPFPRSSETTPTERPRDEKEPPVASGLVSAPPKPSEAAPKTPKRRRKG